MNKPSLFSLHLLVTNYNERLLADLDLYHNFIRNTLSERSKLKQVKWSHKMKIINVVTARYFQKMGNVLTSVHGLQNA